MWSRWSRWFRWSRWSKWSKLTVRPIVVRIVGLIRVVGWPGWSRRSRWFRWSRIISLDDLHSENIWFSWYNPSKFPEKLICHVCDGGGRTDGKWKIVQCSGSPETAIKPHSITSKLKSAHWRIISYHINVQLQIIWGVRHDPSPHSRWQQCFQKRWSLAPVDESVSLGAVNIDAGQS